MYDLHVHCSLSADSEADAVEVVQAAIDKGLKGLCFTDHIDMFYPEDSVAFNFLWEEYDANKARVISAYKDNKDIEILFGVELGIVPGMEKEQMAKLSGGSGLDFILAAQHCIDGEDPYYRHWYEGKDFFEACTLYLQETYKAIRNFDEYDALAHLCTAVKWAPYEHRNFEYNDAKDVFDELLKFIIRKNKGLEINMSAYSRKGFEMPSLSVLTRYKELGGEILTLGSDCHRAEGVGAHLEIAGSIAKKAGFKYLTVFRKRKPEFYTI